MLGLFWQGQLSVCLTGTMSVHSLELLEYQPNYFHVNVASSQSKIPHQRIVVYLIRVCRPCLLPYQLVELFQQFEIVDGSERRSHLIHCEVTVASYYPKEHDEGRRVASESCDVLMLFLRPYQENHMT